MKKYFLHFAIYACSIFHASLTLACTTVAECAQEAVEAALKSEAAHKIAVPSGAVMAFNLKECPQGWKTIKEAKGRVIVGAGSGNRDQNDNKLTNRMVGKTGGEEAHTLTIPEIPSHSHSYQHQANVSGGCGLSGCNSHSTYPSYTTGTTGEGKAHNNMPPFLVLLYCERL